MESWFPEVQQILSTHLKKSETQLVAVSGGLDSVVLSEIFHQLNYPFAIAHVNFGLREEAKDDQLFVKDLAKKYQVPFHTKNVNLAEIPKTGVQDWAREMRYKFFEQTLADFGYKYVVLGQHKDDQIEQFFLKILRPSSIFSLGGIKVLSGNRFRPLLEVSKSDLLDWATKSGASWREDKTNANPEKYQRNWWRLEGIPFLEKKFPDLKSKISGVQKRLRKVEKAYGFLSETFLNPFIVKPQEEVEELDLKALKSEEGAKLVFALFLEEKGFTADNIDKIWNAEWTSESRFFAGLQSVDAELKSGKLYIHPKKASTRKSYIINDESELSALPFVKAVRLCSVLPDFKDWTKKDFLFPCEPKSFPLEIKPADPESDMAILGMGGKTKKIKDIFKDEHIPFCLRNYFYTWENNGGILYLDSLRSSELTRWSGDSVKHYKIELT